ncbi:MAG TPA: PEGA domain-containing protein [Polyangiales bacterium]|nr:PEGA domain-containing protein [Polyangiales bacterium]
MYSRIIVICGTLVLGLGCAASLARAQGTADGDAEANSEARAQLETADRAYRDGRYRDAIAAYLAADQLQPNPALQLALGKAYEQLNETSHALASYREYFNRAPRASDRAHVQERVNALARKLAERGVQQVSVSSSPLGATILIDTKQLGVTPIYVDLPPGRHHLEFRQKGYTSAGLDFELAADQPLNVMTTLVPARAADASAPPVASAAAVAAATVAPAVEDPSPAAPLAETPAAADSTDKGSGDSGSVYRTIGFACLGTSVAALALATTFELMRSHSESKAKQQDEQIAFKETLDTMETQQTWARVFAISAGVLAVSGAVLLVVASEQPEAEAPAKGVSLACGPQGCEASYRGRF